MQERVKVFKYLGRLLAMDDEDLQTVRDGLHKEQRCWARISKVLRSKNAAPKICGMFYRVMVQAVLLFGSETWNVTARVLVHLNGFHTRAAYRMARENVPR